MANAVVAMQQELQRTQDEQNKEREAREQKMLKQKTIGMEMRQRARLAQMQANQEADMQELRSSQNAEYAALISAQANETHELTEMITGMIALGAAWSPAEKQNKPWIAQLKKSRFRASWQLADLQMHIRKLAADGGTTMRLDEMKQKAEALQKKETMEWHDKLMHTTLGEHGSSILSQLVATHKISQAKLLDHHTQKIRLAEKQSATALKMLNGNFRLEKLQLVEKVKQQQKEEEETGIHESSPAVLARRGSTRRGSWASALGNARVKPGWSSASHMAAVDIQNDPIVPLDAYGKLLRVLWNDPKLEVLRSVLRVDATRRLFTKFIEAKSKRDLIGLKLWEQVQDCKLLSGEERDMQAVRLHDAHWAVASEVKSNAVDGATALELLDQRAETTLARMQAAWLAAFLEEHGERFIHFAIKCSRQSDFTAILKPLGNTFIEMLGAAVEDLSFAVCCADMFEPGAHLCCVNKAFEILTGFEREYDEKPEYDPNAAENQIEGEIDTRHKHGTSPLGRNCRFLQGEATDQEALNKVVNALRNGRPAQVELVNYRKDGSPFHNLLSLRPVHDTLGRYRYCIGLLVNKQGWSDMRSAEVNRFFRVLPDSFEHWLQAPQFKEPTAEDAAAAESGPTTRISEIESRDATKVLWLQNLDRSFRALLQNKEAMQVFGEYVKDAQPQMLQDLQMLLEVRRISLLPRDAQVQAAQSLAPEYLPPGEFETVPSDHLPQLFQVRAGLAIGLLATNVLPSFLRSSASDLVVANVQLGSERPTLSGAHLIWASYTPPPDAVKWLFPIVGSVENMDDVGVCISDMRIGGNPLIYVNQGFCKLTGYSKSEVLGRNCRFLQGPNTEPTSVAALVEALRIGSEFTVKMTNYRRSGETFENLLTVRPVHDSNGVYRFSVALLALPSASPAQLQLRAALLQLLPRRIKLEQTAVPCGPYHEERAKQSFFSSIDDELAQAILGEMPARVAADMRGQERYHSNHEEMLAIIAAAPDRLSLTAIYWLAPTAMKQLMQALLTPSLLEIILEQVPQIETRLAGIRLDGKLPVADRGSAHNIAKLLLTPQYMPIFVDVVGGRLMKLAETSKLVEDDDSASNLLPTLDAAHGTTWIDMLQQATADLRFALIACDMHEPGARIVCVNKAFEDLTGHQARDVLGRNCRFLQGETTEQESVAEMVDALRNARSAQVELTNYRKDGTRFKNLLSLRPVHDSNGRYRYSIGVLADVETLNESTIDDLSLLCRVLPRRFESSSQPRRWANLADRRRSLHLEAEALQHSPSESATNALRSSYEERTLSLGKLLWLEDMDRSMQALLRHDEGLQAFEEFLESDLDDASTQASGPLKLVLAVQEVMMMPADDPSMTVQRINAACEIASEHLDPAEVRAIARASMPDELIKRHNQCLHLLASTCLPAFLRSTLSDDVVTRVPLQSERGFASSSHLLWDQYRLQPDAMGWLYSIISAVETMPVSVCVSDMRIAGNPLVYVNQAFCKLTGYSKSEVQGRNCRFLQGPETEVASVSATVEALRRGTDCTVRISNYRRSGEMFESLLTMRSVHDSNGVYRFCVGVQGQMTTGRAQLELMQSFVELIPTHLRVESANPCGPRHQDDRETPHAPLPSKPWGVMLAEAVAGGGSVKLLKAADLQTSVRFARQHTSALHSIGVYDLTRPFTRLMWLAEPLETFRSLVSYVQATIQTPSAHPPASCPDFALRPSSHASHICLPYATDLAHSEVYLTRTSCR